MQGLSEWCLRREFMQALEQDMEILIDKSSELLQQRTPDAFFQQMDSAIIGCALRFSGKSAKQKDNELSALRQRLMELVATRRELRSNIQSVRNLHLRKVAGQVSVEPLCVVCMVVCWAIKSSAAPKAS